MVLVASGDLEIYHDGSHSYIKDTGTGHLRLATDEFRVSNAAVDETIIDASQDGGVGLYHNDSKKLDTTSSGISVTGDITTSLSVALGSGYNLTWGGAYGSNIPTIVGVSGGSARILFYPAGSTSGEKASIDASGNATFAGKVAIGGTHLGYACNIYADEVLAVRSSHQYKGAMSMRVNSGAGDSGTTVLYVATKASMAGSGSDDHPQILAQGSRSLGLGFNTTEVLTLDSSSNATFAGNIYALSDITGNGGLDIYADDDKSGANSGRLHLHDDGESFFSSDNDNPVSLRVWRTSGSVQHSATLDNDGKLTVTGGGSFAGNITRDKITIDTDHILFSRNGSYAASRAWRWRVDDSAWGNFDLKRSNGEDNTIDTAVLSFNNSGNATFAGDVTIPNKLIHAGNTNTYLQFETDVVNINAHSEVKLKYQESSRLIARSENVELYARLVGTNAIFSGNISSTAGNIDIAATKKIFLDGGGDTYIQEDSANNILFQSTSAKFAGSVTIKPP